MSARDYILEHIDIEVNHSCNLACRHCSARAAKGRLPEELNATEIQEVLSGAKKLGLRKVGLTGGEPLVDVPKLGAIARFCIDELDVPIHMHTNGTMVTEDMCRHDGVLALFEAVSVTFLGGDAETHDYMTKVKGSFEKALQGAKVIAKAGLPLTCYYIPTHGTCKGYKDLTPKLRDIGVKRIRAMALAPSGRARPIYGETAPLADEMREFEKDLLEAGSKFEIHIEAGNCTRLSMPHLTVLNGHERCMSGINRVHINSKGDVFPCTAASGVKELRLGNLKKNGFHLENIWFSSEIIKLIREIHNGGISACAKCSRKPKCRAGCTVNACGTMSEETRLMCPLTNPRIRNSII
ncbi:MAG TPA: radical SAM protein [Sedimentisphaerales bacterium]|nr:radical SAM protein [Sedimentisphaerales bacterium]